MAYTGINFRGTALGPGGSGNPTVDPAGTTYCLGNSDVYPVSRGGLVFGTPSSMGFSADDQATLDPRLHGYARFAAIAQTERFDLGSAGRYSFRCALYARSVASPQSLYIFDGSINDPVNGASQATVLAASLTSYPAASGAVAANRYVFYGGRLYRSGASGNVSATPTPPSHTSGTVNDGTVAWTYIRSALHFIYNPSVNDAILDASGTVRGTSAVWASSQAPSPTVTVTNTYVTLCKGNDNTSQTSIRHFSAQAEPSPLDDAVVRNQFNVETASPTFYAGEAPGTPLFRLTVSAGANLPANWSFGGAMAGYLEVRTIGGETWVCVSDTRIPDSMAGEQAIDLIQTDVSELISGSPYTTTVTVTVVSSEGRDVSKTKYGRVSTAVALIRKAVADAHADLFAGYAGQSTAGRSTTVNSAASFVTAWNAITPDGVSWYRIGLQDGSYDGQVILNNKDFGTGGLLIEPEPGHDPEVNVSTGGYVVVKGLHMRGLKIPGFTTPATYYNWRFGDLARVKIENVRAGYMYHAGAVETAIADDRGGPTNACTPFLMQGCESIEVIDSVFDGCAQTIVCIAVRRIRVVGNMRRRGNDDFLPIGLGNIDLSATGRADLNCYALCRGNVDHREIDYPGFTTLAHLDFIQLRPWTVGNAPYGTQCLVSKSPSYRNWVVGDLTYNNGHWYKVSAVTTGVASGVAPTHTAGTAVDGGVTWQWMGALAQRQLFLDMDENYLLSSKNEATANAGTQFLWDGSFDVGEHPWLMNIAAYNNFESCPTLYGMFMVSRGKHYFEYNAFGGGYEYKAGMQLIPSGLGSAHPESVMWDRGNYYGQVPNAEGLLASFDSAVIPFTSAGVNPGTYLRGTFTYTSGTLWTFPLVDTVDATADEVKESMQSQLLAKPGSGFGPIIPTTYTQTVSFTLTGADGGSANFSFPVTVVSPG